MSYVVLARKYRPPNFEALVGQEHVVQALSNALTQQRLHHAYLFTGTRGVGKTTISRILAKSLNCTGPDGTGGITAHPCGVCEACRDIDAGRHMDYVELDAASNRGVDEISQLLDQAVYKPVIGRFKVYMIDEVHMLSSHAFNAMLKTLEEPPEYLKFVLATTDPQKVPPTVLSRCLQFNLRPMAPQTVQLHLADVLDKEHIAAEPGALRLLARGARGSMRDALSLTDQAIAFGAGALTEEGVRLMLGAVDRGHVVRIVEALAASDGAALVGAVDGLRSLGLSAGGTLEEMAALLQQMAVVQAVPDALDADDPDTPEATRLAALLAPDETQLVYSIAMHGRAELGLAPDEYSGLVMVLLRMLAFRPKGGAPRSVAPAVVAAKPVAARPAAVSASISASMSASTPAARAPGVAQPAPAAAVRAPAVAQPAVVAPPPALRVAPAASSEPPPWMDELDEAEMSSEATKAPPTRPSPSNASSNGSSSRPASNAQRSNASAPDVAVRELASTPYVPAATNAAAPIDFVPTPLGDRWSEIVRGLNDAGGISAFARELAMQAQCIVLDDNASPIAIQLRIDRETLRAAAPCDKLQAALSESFGRAVRLEVIAGAAEDSTAKRDAIERARRQAHAEQIIQNDPLVQALMSQYKTARIVPGSVKPH